ncbi:LOB domain-containing protein 29-like [Prosopis cineraria]|uniref:LOB domain-containing protein 29-like n=1 Tax=Prosopis cineraria TaxID=364024 RepID=UPI00240EB954|nr:LOB domain-containing protein 29-like [Prosopis cineraria]
MTGSGSPCGACKFLRRKCVRGCVFAPYFCHEQGASHFAAIHKVFGASNVSKLLAHLPVSDRCEAAVTISYEAQARVQDPIYGCVSHIFALQQQVVNLQAQLAYLREQAAQSHIVNASVTENPNKPTAFTDHDLQKWFPTEDPTNTGTQFLPSSSDINSLATQYYGNYTTPFVDPNPIGSSGTIEESASFSSFHEETNCNSMSLDMQASSRQWSFREVDDLQSVAFGYSG